VALNTHDRMLRAPRYVGVWGVWVCVFLGLNFNAQIPGFQWLEVRSEKLPMLGKSVVEISNHWKKNVENFQPLEESRQKVPIIGKTVSRISKHWNFAVGYVSSCFK
jgi:hypothetical protein